MSSRKGVFGQSGQSAHPRLPSKSKSQEPQHRPERKFRARQPADIHRSLDGCPGVINIQNMGRSREDLRIDSRTKPLLFIEVLRTCKTQNCRGACALEISICQGLSLQGPECSPGIKLLFSSTIGKNPLLRFRSALKDMGSSCSSFPALTLSSLDERLRKVVNAGQIVETCHHNRRQDCRCTPLSSCAHMILTESLSTFSSFETLQATPTWRSA